MRTMYSSELLKKIGNVVSKDKFQLPKAYQLKYVLMIDPQIGVNTISAIQGCF